MKIAPVRMGERVAFAAGDAGFNLAWQTIELYLLFYYIRIAGLPPAAAAGIFLVGAATDLFADPLVGALVDRMSARVPVRNWMLLAGPPLGVALALAFVVPPFGPAGTVAFCALTHFLLRITYGLGNIPYATLTSRISDDPAEHSRLTSSRMQGAALGGLAAALTYLALPLQRQWHGVPVGAIALGLAAQPLFLWTWLGVRERHERPTGNLPGVREQLRGLVDLLWRSSELRHLLLLILAVGTSLTVVHKGLLFIFDHLHARGVGYVAALIPSLALFAGAPLAARLARRYGIVPVFRGACAVQLCALLLAWIGHGGVYPTIAFIIVVMLGSAGMATMFWSMVPTVVESCERRFAAEGCAARIFALSNTARKLGQALAPQIIALALSRFSGDILPASVAMAALALVSVAVLTRRT